MKLLLATLIALLLVPIHSGAQSSCLWGEEECPDWRHFWGDAYYENAFAVTWSHEAGWTYTNDWTFTGCSNDVGSNPATTVVESPTPNCDLYGLALEVAGTPGEGLILDDAFDSTGYSKLYVQFHHLMLTALTAAKTEHTFTNDAQVILAPKLNFTFFAPFNFFQMACDTSASVPWVYSNNTWYIIQLDMDFEAGATQTMRVYALGGGAPLDTQTCTNTAAQAVAKGWQFGTDGGAMSAPATIRTYGLIISTSPIDAP